VMVDVAMRWQPAARTNTAVPGAYGLQSGAYLLLTAHRAGNVDDPQRLRALVELIESLPAPVLFPIHPRTRARLKDAGLLARLAGVEGVELSEPLGYVEFSALVCQARAVLTDSGGVQKEAYLAGVPCLTLRANTEWVETVEAGWNTLVDLDAGAALAALERPTPAARPELYGDGHAAWRRSSRCRTPQRAAQSRWAPYALRAFSSARPIVSGWLRTIEARPASELGSCAMPSWRRIVVWSKYTRSQVMRSPSKRKNAAMRQRNERPVGGSDRSGPRCVPSRSNSAITALSAW
jgi:hypothetical protein